MAGYVPAGQTEIANLALQELGQQPIDDIDDLNDNAARLCSQSFWPVVRQVGRAHNWNCLQRRLNLVQLALPGASSTDSTSFGWNCGHPTTPPPYWLANTAYTGATLVTYGEAIYYCLMAYTSSGNFINDMTAGFWAQIYSTFFGGNSPGGVNGYEWKFGYLLPPDYLLITELNGNDCRNNRGVGSLYEIFAYQTNNPADESISNLSALFCDTPFANVKYTALIQDPTLFDALFVDCVAVMLASKVATTLLGDGGKLASSLRTRYAREVLPNAMLKDAGEEKLRRYDPTQDSNFLRARRGSTNG